MYIVVCVQNTNLRLFIYLLITFVRKVEFFDHKTPWVKSFPTDDVSHSDYFPYTK